MISLPTVKRFRIVARSFKYIEKLVGQQTPVKDLLRAQSAVCARKGCRMLAAVDRATAEDGLLGVENHPTILLMDRDTKFSEAFRSKLKDNGVKPLVLLLRSPNLNAFMGAFKRELI